MAAPRMMCPSCLGHGHFRENVPCDTCRGTGSVTVAAGQKFLAAEREEKASAASPTARPRRASASASRGSRKRAKKAGNISARKAAVEAEATPAAAE